MGRPAEKLGQGRKSLEGNRRGGKAGSRATKKSLKAEIKGDIIEFLWRMKKQGYADLTIESKNQILQRLIRLGANLNDPESVKEILARQKWSPGRKANAVYAYSLYCKFKGLT